MAEKIRKRLLSSEITGPAALPGLYYCIWSGNISSDALSDGRLNVRPLVHNGWLGAYGVWCIRVTTGGESDHASHSFYAYNRSLYPQFSIQNPLLLSPNPCHPRPILTALRHHPNSPMSHKTTYVRVYSTYHYPRRLIQCHEQIDEVTQRLSELSLLESLLCHELRSMLTTPRLVFESPPSSVNDAPSALLPSSTDSDNQQFLALRSSLQSKHHVLRLLPPLGDKDVDRRRGKLIAKVSAELSAMDSQQSMAWEQKKLLVGLYGFLDETETKAPRVYHTGTFSYLLIRQ